MRNIYLVARRDYLGYVTAWGFWLGLLLTPVLLAIFSLAPALAASTQPTRYYTVVETGTEFSDALQAQFDRSRIAAARAQIRALELVGQDVATMEGAFDAAIEAGKSPEDALAAAGAPGSSLPVADYVPVPPPAQDADALRPWLQGDRMVETPDGALALFAAIIVPDDGGPIEYWSENITAGELIRTARDAARTLARDDVFAAAGVPTDILQDARDAARDVEERRPRSAEGGGDGAVTQADRAPYFASIILAFVLWMLIFSVVNYLLMGTIEERSNKIFDTLLTSVRLPQLLAGKLIAVLAVSLTLMAFWGVGGAAVTAYTSSFIPSDAAATISSIAGAALQPQIILPALVSFLLGYLMYGSVFLALGSLCDTVQEAQTLMTPLLVLLMSPMLMFVIAIDDPTSAVVQVMSWVPVFTPFLLILKMPTEPPMWEVVAQLALMVVATALVLWLATKVYRAGAVHGTGVSDVAAGLKRLIPGAGRKAKSDA